MEQEELKLDSRIAPIQLQLMVVKIVKEMRRLSRMPVMELGPFAQVS